jgi:nucleoid-associated protein YgaU
MSNDKKPDFSNVQSKVQSTGKIEDKPGFNKPDFSNVQSKVASTGEIAGDSGERTYTVERGDTLSHIAKAHYGKASKWHAIFEANRDQIDDPDKIFPGQVLKIPAIDIDGDGSPD